MKNLFLLSIGINTDIFETNIINIALLLVLLFNVVGAALKTSMLERKTQILTEVEGSEQSLTEAVERLSQAEEQSKQVALIISQIEDKTESTQEQIYMNNWKRSWEETERIKETADLRIKLEEQKIARENKDALLVSSFAKACQSIINDVTYEEICQLNMKRIKKIPAVV